jgi:hypothetical protein
MHDCTVFVINDAGTWMLKRPQDYPRNEIPELIRQAREKRLLGLYEKARVRIADRRLDVPREVPFVAPFNKWMSNVPGTTFFLPVAELSALYINVMLSAFDEDFSMFVVVDRNGYQPAGIGAFARSAGGTLHDDSAEGRVLTVGFVETWMCEFVAIEQGAIHQNLGLMCAALGLGGFPHFAAHPFAWPPLSVFGWKLCLSIGSSGCRPELRPTLSSPRRSVSNGTARFCSSSFARHTTGIWARCPCLPRLQICRRTRYLPRRRHDDGLGPRFCDSGSHPPLLRQERLMQRLPTANTSTKDTGVFLCAAEPFALSLPFRRTG